MDENRRHGLARRTAEAWQRDAAGLAELRRRGHTVSPGELYVLPSTAGVEIEWLVVRPDGAEGGTAGAGERYLVVAADVVPLAGSADVAVSGSAGPLTVRCGVGAWVEARHFDRGRRSGLVEGDVLDQVREKRRRIESGQLLGSAVEREVDRDPEHAEWLDTLATERDSLAALHPPTRHRRQRRSAGRRGPWPRPLVLTASIVVAVVALALAAISWQEPDDSSSGVLINLPIVGLSDQPRRGPATRFTLPAGTPGFLLVLGVPGGEPERASYRLEIRHAKSGKVVVGRDPLRALGIGELTLVLRRGELPAGEHELLLYRQQADRELLVGRFRLHLILEAERPP